MAQANVDITIRGRDAFSGAFAKFRSDVSRTFGGLKGMIAGALGGIGVAEVLRKSFAAFQEQETATNRLRAALGQLGPVTEETMAGFNDFASTIQNLTVIGDDAVLNLAALGASMGRLSGQTLKQATIAAIGLSRSLNIDVNTAMTLIAKAAQGNTRTFSLYGIQLDASASATEKFRTVLRRGINDFKLARAETETTAGKIMQLKNAIGDLGEVLGAALAPGVMRLVEAVKLVVLNIQNLRATFAGLLGEALKGVAALLGGLSAAAAGLAALERRLSYSGNNQSATLFQRWSKDLGNFAATMNKVADAFRKNFADAWGKALADNFGGAKEAALGDLGDLQGAIAKFVVPKIKGLGELFGIDDAFIGKVKDFGKQMVEAQAQAKRQQLALAFAGLIGLAPQVGIIKLLAPAIRRAFDGVNKLPEQPKRPWIDPVHRGVEAINSQYLTRALGVGGPGGEQKQMLTWQQRMAEHQKRLRDEQAETNRLLREANRLLAFKRLQGID